MPALTEEFKLERCPHCSTHVPSLRRQHSLDTVDHAGQNKRHWCVYACKGCGGLVIAVGKGPGSNASAHYPSGIDQTPDEAIPSRAREYLRQALNSSGAAAGAVMLAASAVDAMLKSKGLTDGTLYKRIDRAVVEHLITAEMGQWAHAVRLDANDQRHADEVAELPTAEDARRVVEFAQALAQFLFVLPARVKRGLTDG